MQNLILISKLIFQHSGVIFWSPGTLKTENLKFPLLKIQETEFNFHEKVQKKGELASQIGQKNWISGVIFYTFRLQIPHFSPIFMLKKDKNDITFYQCHRFILSVIIVFFISTSFNWYVFHEFCEATPTFFVFSPTNFRLRRHTLAHKIQHLIPAILLLFGLQNWLNSWEKENCQKSMFSIDFSRSKVQVFEFLTSYQLFYLFYQFLLSYQWSPLNLALIEYNHDLFLTKLKNSISGFRRPGFRILKNWIARNRAVIIVKMLQIKCSIRIFQSNVCSESSGARSLEL